jgi:methylase of polypeptide subunit release factors
MGSGPIALDQLDVIEQLRGVLGRMGYTGEAIRTVLGEDAYQGRMWDVPVHVRRLQSGTPLETAIKSLFLGLPVQREEVDVAFAPVTAQDLQRLGLVEPGDSPLLSSVRVVPHAELLLAGNRYPDEAPGGTPADYVATVTAPSAILATLTARDNVRTALDVGTGSGIQALWAARHCDRVVAVDINPRALNLAAFNARLNGVDNVEFRQGSLFEPVAGERFDLIVSNAPYVVSPDTRYAFRDGGLVSDDFCARLVRESVDHLEEGGFAELLISWILDDEEWSSRPKAWVDGSGCDCWLLLGAKRDPLTHAALWNEELKRDSKSYAETLDRWVSYLDDLGAEAVLEGAAILRCRTGARNWFRADRIPPGRPEPASDHVQRVFRNQSYLSGLSDDDALLDETLRLVESARIEQELHCRDGGYVVDSMTLALDEGLGFRAGVDQRTAALVPLLDGDRPLRQSIDAAANAFAFGSEDREAFTRGALGVVREMLELGFVVRAEEGPHPTEGADELLFDTGPSR